MKPIASLLIVMILGATGSSCAPTYRVVTGRCPTTTMLLSDFALGTGAVLIAGIAYSLQDPARSAAALGIGAAMLVGGNVAEMTCR